MAKKKVVETKAVKKSEVKPNANGKMNGIDETPKTKKIALKRKVPVEEDEDLPVTVPKGKKRNVKVEKEDEERVELSSEEEAEEKRAKKKRKTKKQKAAEVMPLASRTVGHKLFIGAHVSASGGQYRCETSYNQFTRSENFYRRSKFYRQQRAHRRQRLRTLLEISTQMG